MGAEEYKKQCEFERNLKKGDKCLAFWTNSGNYYRAQVEVEAINQKSYRVRMAEAIEGYPVGWKLNIPNAANYDRFTWNNRLAPLPDDVCPECGQHRPGDERVRAGMKCGFCAY